MGLLTLEQIAEIHTLRLEKKMTISALAHTFHCSIPTIHKAIHFYDDDTKQSKRFVGERLEQLLEAYTQEKNLGTLARTFEVTRGTIKNALIKAGVYEEEEKTQSKMLSPEKEQEFLRDYAAGKTLHALTIQYERSEYILKQILAAHPEIVRHGVRQWTENELRENQEIIAAYKNGEYVATLAKKYNRNEGPIMTLLKHAGIDIEAEQARRKQEREQQREQQRFASRFQKTVRIPRHYEIACSDAQDAEALRDEIIHLQKQTYPYEKDVRFSVQGATLLLDGEFTAGFHRTMLMHYVEEDATASQ